MIERLSYRAIHALAVRDVKRLELGRALERVRVATHVAVAIRGPRTVWCFGDRRECDAFAAGLERDVRVESITDADRARLDAHAIRSHRT